MPVVAGAVSHFGYFGFIFVLFVSIVGMFAGDCVWFWTGRFFGKKIKKTQFFQSKFPKIEKFIDQIGIWQILLSRVLYGTRIVTMLIWGIREISFFKFAVVDLIGCAIWGSLLVSLGYFLSFSLNQIIGDIKQIEIFLLFIVILVVILIVLKKLLLKPKIREVK